MVIAEVSIIPIGTKTSSVSKYIAKAIESIKQQTGVSYQLTAMGTLLEGRLDDVLGAVVQMHKSVFDRETKRVVTNIRIDDRRDKKIDFCYKVQSITKKLGE
jgi:uncharacterized protein (TIGR00106 family)